ncbi:MAG: hypothetical protein CMP96_00435 [Gammaproteobacteria bacterium]|nr:hypothetical protein [Gammaproteobacteria bacterium]
MVRDPRPGVPGLRRAASSIKKAQGNAVGFEWVRGVTRRAGHRRYHATADGALRAMQEFRGINKFTSVNGLRR